MRRRAFFTGGAVLLAGCAGALILWASYFSPEARSKDVVRGRLFDPESAVFRGVKRSTRDPDVWCGEVNARNRFGGMVGFTRYVVYIDNELNLGLHQVHFDSKREESKADASDVFPSKWKMFCE